MTRTIRLTSALSAFLALATPAAAQQGSNSGTPPAPATATAPATPQAKGSWKDGRTIPIQYFRPQDKRGLNVFETTKTAGAEFDGFKLDFGAGFTSQVQNLTHSNTATRTSAAATTATRSTTRLSATTSSTRSPRKSARKFT